jgi:hypothetical protein
MGQAATETLTAHCVMTVLSRLLVTMMVITMMMMMMIIVMTEKIIQALLSR